MNICIDLDGTLLEWHDDHTKLGRWKPGAREALRELLDSGHRVTVHTCRATWEAGGGYAGVKDFLVREGFPEVKVWNGQGKPIAHVYIDDRAIEYRENWPQVMKRLRRMM